MEVAVVLTNKKVVDEGVDHTLTVLLDEDVDYTLYYTLTV